MDFKDKVKQSNEEYDIYNVNKEDSMDDSGVCSKIL